ncbi:MAG TPA: septum formation initiator family protein [Devosiaceae bacterium]|jgi:cell division protein FtsB|nr:septum formation initiator family protein [Devosiaceae bacterium]
MPTRLKRPPFWRHLLVAGALIGFQAYLGFNVVSGQYGIESQKRMHAEIQELQAQSAALQARIDGYRHRVTLFDPQRLDPDIVTERSRALLSMADPRDVVVMVDPRTGKPHVSSFSALADKQLIELIEASTVE